MEPGSRSILPAGHALWLVFLSLVGVVTVMLVTGPYGVGVNSDSVAYIYTARSLMHGAGAVSYDGPLVLWPPLFPALMAGIGVASGRDPVMLARLVNAVLFGLTVFLGGALLIRRASGSWAISLLGTLAILASIPLFSASVMVWSEPLFIVFTLMGLLAMDKYLSERTTGSLLALALAVGLACLTRYIGVTLILWGAVSIMSFSRESIRRRLAHCIVFSAVAGMPLGFWLVRNYAVSGTLFGPRAPSQLGVLHNVLDTFKTISFWYTPRIGAVMFLFAMAFFLVCVGIRNNWSSAKAALGTVLPVGLFVIIYTAFLVVSSSITSYDQINSRLLCPIYVPVSLVALVALRAAVEPFRGRLGPAKAEAFIAFCIAIWLPHLVGFNIHASVSRYSTGGGGFGGRDWLASDTSRYLRQHPAAPDGVTYTNSPEAAYIMADAQTKRIPEKVTYDKRGDVRDISAIAGVWPTEGKVRLVWFDKIQRGYLVSIEDITGVADVVLIARFRDGAVYTVARKQGATMKTSQFARLLANSSEAGVDILVIRHTAWLAAFDDSQSDASGPMLLCCTLENHSW